MTDVVNRPPHYTSHPSGVECIQITEHMNFNLGNAIKYIWRADEKGKALEDLAKAKFYIEREMQRRSGDRPTSIQISTDSQLPLVFARGQIVDDYGDRLVDE